MINRLFLPALGVALCLSAACKPGSSVVDAGCINAIAGRPDGSYNQVCAWNGTCTSTALQAAVDQLIGDAGECTEDTDCVFITDGGPYSFDHYSEAYVNPVAIQNVEALQAALENLICGYQQSIPCTDGGGELINLGVPSSTPQSSLCLQCYMGQCVANPVIAGP